MVGTEHLEVLALKNMISGSEAMFERRRRILREARAIIIQQGPDRLNMRDLSEKAGVSTKTIYNAFGSKETVVALAIYTNFQKFVERLKFEESATSFEGALARQITSTMRDIDIPHFMKAVVSLYFSPTVHPAIRGVLHDLSTRSWMEWLISVEDKREFKPGVVMRELLADLSNLQYATILDWSNQSTSDEIFLRRSLSGILTLLMGSCIGDTHEQLQKAFVNLQCDQEFRTNLFAQSRTRIDDAIVTLGAKNRKRQKSGKRSVL
jgi:AcrR family transcriptional regulator